MRGVYAYLPDYDDERIPLTINPETGLYEGELPLPDVFENGRVRIRIVVRDLARNRFEQTLTVYENEAALSAAASEGDPEAQRMDTCAKRPSPQIVLALR
ncbi:MAG: hypothetical protein M5R36_01370 [Deltaproteobacteria bacterium]|nr:hypothetical protein [Deltaproteobacteria bacterium]